MVKCEFILRGEIKKELAVRGHMNYWADHW
jgi:hypothetical protein